MLESNGLHMEKKQYELWREAWPYWSGHIISATVSSLRLLCSLCAGTTEITTTSWTIMDIRCCATGPLKHSNECPLLFKKLWWERNRSMRRRMSPPSQMSCCRLCRYCCASVKLNTCTTVPTEATTSQDESSATNFYTPTYMTMKQSVLHYCKK